MQEGSPGIGNWMADEILWQAGIDPRQKLIERALGDLARLMESDSERPTS